jgi:hypothetical protein
MLLNLSLPQQTMKIIKAQQAHSIEIFKNLEEKWDTIIKMIMFIKAQQYEK